MAFKFPFTNYHELNLTWVLDQLKKLFEESNENVETIESYENRLSTVETELPVVEATANQAETVANAAASLAQTAKNTADTANENALTASAQAGLARQEAATAEAEAQAATQAAQQAQAAVQDFDGRITQAEADASEALQEAQSFENRVNAAINTANNAANTATIAQGIAVNANQNAATALDTAHTADGKADMNADNIGDLSELTTTAKSNLVAAINEAAQSGGGGSGAVNSVNGKTGVVVLNAGDLEYNASASYNTGTVGNAIKQLESDISGLIENVNSQSIWSQGKISVGGSGGNIVEDTKAITTTNMISDNVSIALVDNTCKFSIAVYSSANAWMGFLRYENDTYSLNNYNGTNFNEISYSEIASAYPSCKIRIMVQKVSTSATISPSEYAAVSITKTDIPTPYTSNPAMDGTASPGVSGNFARGDHVHPSDTSKADKTSYVTLGGTQVTQIGVDNTMYLCGELTELTFTAPATGQTAIRFSSGTTPTVVTLTGVTMPDDWIGAEANTTYEINVLNGYGVFQSWT